MKAITPSSPILTLTVKPKGDSSSRDVLAQFHPIMKSLGYGNFQMEGTDLYVASKSTESLFHAERYVFAEIDGDSVVFNIDGHSVFGLKGVEEQLKMVKVEYERTMDCTAELNGPDYTSAFIGNLLYTALPIYASAALVVSLLVATGDFNRPILLNVFLYATLGTIGAKTRFWVNQRRKQRPVWKSILILLIGAPIAIGIVVLFFWAIDKFA